MLGGALKVSCCEKSCGRAQSSASCKLFIVCQLVLIHKCENCSFSFLCRSTS